MYVNVSFRKNEEERGKVEGGGRKKKGGGEHFANFFIEVVIQSVDGKTKKEKKNRGQ